MKPNGFLKKFEHVRRISLRVFIALFLSSNALNGWSKKVIIFVSIKSFSNLSTENPTARNEAVSAPAEVPATLLTVIRCPFSCRHFRTPKNAIPFGPPPRKTRFLGHDSVKDFGSQGN